MQLLNRTRARVGLFIIFAVALLARVSGAERLIAICGAYPPEIAALEKAFGATASNGFSKTTIAGVDFWRGQYAGKDIVVFCTGMSLVNAASHLQLALDHFPITHILFAGVAGGVDPALHVGDVAIPEKWAYHGETVYLNDDGKGGYIKPDYFTIKYENFGMIFPEEVGAVRDGEELLHVPAFPADPELLALARKVAPTLPKMQKAGRDINVVVGGTGVSGTVFLDNAKYREWIYKVWQAHCVDMESTAFAQVAFGNRKPILIVRGLSDLAGGQAGANPISNNEASVSDIATAVLRGIVDKM